HVQLFCVQSESLSTGPLSRGLSCGLLPPRRERPRRRRASEQRDEVAPHQVDHEAYSSRLSQPTTEGARGALGHTLNEPAAPTRLCPRQRRRGVSKAFRAPAVPPQIRTRVISIGRMNAPMRSDLDRASQSAVALEPACLISSRGDRGYQLPCPDASACSAAIRTLSGCHGLRM